MANAVCRLDCVDGFRFLPLQNTVALAGASGCDTLKSKKTFKMGSNVEAGASSNVKAINFLPVEMEEMSTSEISQTDGCCADFMVATGLSKVILSAVVLGALSLLNGQEENTMYEFINKMVALLRRKRI